MSTKLLVAAHAPLAGGYKWSADPGAHGWDFHFVAYIQPESAKTDSPIWLGGSLFGPPPAQPVGAIGRIRTAVREIATPVKMDNEVWAISRGEYTRLRNCELLWWGDYDWHMAQVPGQEEQAVAFANLRAACLQRE